MRTGGAATLEYPPWRTGTPATSINFRRTPASERAIASFFETWPTVIAQYDHDTSIEIRTLPHYEAAKRTRALAIADPSINPDTGYPVMSLGYPIVVHGEFIGFVGANITFGVVSRFLDSHKVSPNSTTFIIDRDGRIIAHPNPASGVRTTAQGKIEFATIADFGNQAAARAAREQAARKSDRVEFTLDDGTDYVALFSPFPASFMKPWQVVSIAPVDDFVGDLKRTNRALAILILSLIGAGVALIFLVAKRVARPLEAITGEMRNVQALKFGRGIPARSFIREIYDLQSAARLMSNSLRSFSAFVPIGIIRQLIDSGRPLMPSGESRFLTIFFSDLEKFSTIAESLPPEDLVRQVSSYFEAAAGAITQEAGTIDKFIGDSVMAFWGAPSPVEDHVYRACVGALRVASRVERLNREWSRDGRPQMRVRIGLHCADVVVGNFGSSDRLNYTAMGDGVNVASRLEQLNKTFNTTICISDSVHDAVADRIVARPIQIVSVKGRRGSFMVYELIGIRDATDPELRADDAAVRLCAMTTAAMNLWRTGRLDAARAKYREILAAFPDDPVAKLMHEADTVVQ